MLRLNILLITDFARSLACLTSWDWFVRLEQPIVCFIAQPSHTEYFQMLPWSSSDYIFMPITMETLQTAHGTSYPSLLNGAQTSTQLVCSRKGEFITCLLVMCSNAIPHVVFVAFSDSKRGDMTDDKYHETLLICFTIIAHK